ncbi:MAG: glycerophosphodiester phosphodiesterase family protein [Planctomycetota bacterium]
MLRIPALSLATLIGVAVPAQQQASALLARLQRAAEEAPLVVAHRGASADAPENTLAALRLAKAAGADVIEFDVYQTKDGAWVVLHDATVDRTTDVVAKLGRKKVRIDELSLDEARSLDAGAWFDAKFAGEKLPTLAEAIEAILPAVPMIERKGGDPKALVAELQRLQVADQVLVQAFDWDWLEQVHAAAPELLLGALSGGEPTADKLRDVDRTGAKIVHWDHRTVTVDTAAAVRTASRMLCVYTVDPDLALVGAAAIGCDMVTTNRPAHMIELRRRGALRRPRQ